MLWSVVFKFQECQQWRERDQKKLRNLERWDLFVCVDHLYCVAFQSIIILLWPYLSKISWNAFSCRKPRLKRRRRTTEDKKKVRSNLTKTVVRNNMFDAYFLTWNDCLCYGETTTEVVAHNDFSFMPSEILCMYKENLPKTRFKQNKLPFLFQAVPPREASQTK